MYFHGYLYLQLVRLQERPSKACNWKILSFRHSSVIQIPRGDQRKDHPQKDVDQRQKPENE